MNSLACDIYSNPPTHLAPRYLPTLSPCAYCTELQAGRLVVGLDKALLLFLQL